MRINQNRWMEGVIAESDAEIKMIFVGWARSGAHDAGS